MKVKLAEVYGFCPGVRRAVEMVEEHLEKHGPLATLGAIVHNAQVVEELGKKGARMVESLAEVREGAVAVTAHGAGPEVFEEIRRRGLVLVDTTCPIVRRAQEAASRLSEEGFFVVIYGEEAHPEVRGLLSWTKGKGKAALKPEELREVPSARLALISQTTKSREEFWAFVSQVVGRFSGELREVRALDTTCPETGRRYQAVLSLAKRRGGPRGRGLPQFRQYKKTCGGSALDRPPHLPHRAGRGASAGVVFRAHPSRGHRRRLYPRPPRSGSAGPPVPNRR
jgi:4-hydroxy-3-methylbut-2-enyl diphosphate reductase